MVSPSSLQPETAPGPRIAGVNRARSRHPQVDQRVEPRTSQAIRNDGPKTADSRPDPRKHSQLYCETKLTTQDTRWTMGSEDGKDWELAVPSRCPFERIQLSGAACHSWPRRAPGRGLPRPEAGALTPGPRRRMRAPALTRGWISTTGRTAVRRYAPRGSWGLVWCLQALKSGRSAVRPLAPNHKSNLHNTVCITTAETRFPSFIASFDW